MSQVRCSNSVWISSSCSLIGKPEVKVHTDLQMKPWTGDRTDTKNWEIYLRLNCLSGIKTEKGERQAFLSQFSPNKQCADEKWEHKQAGEPRMYSPNTENVPLKSETIFSERQSWLDMKWVRQQHREQSTDGSGRFFSLCLLSYLIILSYISVQFLPALELPTALNNKIVSHKIKKSSKYLHLIIQNDAQNSCLLTYLIICIILCCHLLYLYIPPWMIKKSLQSIYALWVSVGEISEMYQSDTVTLYWDRNWPYKE